MHCPLEVPSLSSIPRELWTTAPPPPPPPNHGSSHKFDDGSSSFRPSTPLVAGAGKTGLYSAGTATATASVGNNSSSSSNDPASFSSYSPETRRHGSTAAATNGIRTNNKTDDAHVEVSTGDQRNSNISPPPPLPSYPATNSKSVNRLSNNSSIDKRNYCTNTVRDEHDTDMITRPNATTNKANTSITISNQSNSSRNNYQNTNQESINGNNLSSSNNQYLDTLDNNHQRSLSLIRSSSSSRSSNSNNQENVSESNLLFPPFPPPRQELAQLYKEAHCNPFTTTYTSTSFSSSTSTTSFTTSTSDRNSGTRKRDRTTITNSDLQEARGASSNHHHAAALLPLPVCVLEPTQLPEHVLKPGLYSGLYGDHGYEIVCLEYAIRQITLIKVSFVAFILKIH